MTSSNVVSFKPRKMSAVTFVAQTIEGRWLVFARDEDGEEIMSDHADEDTAIAAACELAREWPATYDPNGEPL